MSRRSRSPKRSGNRKPAGKRTSKRNAIPWYAKAGILGSLGLILLILVGYGSIRAYLKGDGFRYSTATKIGDVLGGDGEMEGLKWRGWDPELDSFSFTNGKGALKNASASEVELEVDLSSLGGESWNIPHVEIMDLELAFSEPDPDYVPYEIEKPSGLLGLLPYKSKLNTFEAKRVDTMLTLDGKNYEFGEMRAKGKMKTRDDIRIELSNGFVKLPYEELKEVEHIDSILYLKDGDIILEDARVNILNDKPAKVSAHYKDKEGSFELRLQTRDIDIEPFMLSDWSQSLSGRAILDATVRVEADDPLESYEGEIEIERAEVKALPVLDRVAGYVKNISYRHLDLDVAKCKFKIRGQRTELSEIDIEERNKLAVRGRLTMAEDKSLDGLLRVGVPAGVLSFLPGAETKVFLPGERGLLWATVRIGGDIDNIEEDLSSQLVAAAAERMFEIIPETGEKALRILQGRGGDPSDPLTGVIGGGSQNSQNPVGDVIGNVLGLGTGFAGDLLGVGSSNTENQWQYKQNGFEFTLTNTWKKTGDSGEKPFARLERNGRLIGEYFLEVKQGKAAAVIEERRKASKGEVGNLSQFVTRSGFFAYITSETIATPAADGVRSSIISSIQVSNDLVFLLEMKNQHRDVDIAKNYMQEVAKTLVKEKPAEAEKLIPDGGILERVNPGGLIPGF